MEKGNNSKSKFLGMDANGSNKILSSSIIIRCFNKKGNVYIMINVGNKKK